MPMELLSVLLSFSMGGCGDPYGTNFRVTPLRGSIHALPPTQSICNTLVVQQKQEIDDDQAINSGAVCDGSTCPNASHGGVALVTPRCTSVTTPVCPEEGGWTEVMSRSLRQRARIREQGSITPLTDFKGSVMATGTADSVIIRMAFAPNPDRNAVYSPMSAFLSTRYASEGMIAPPPSCGSDLT
jgi:hypothetical protein